MYTFLFCYLSTLCIDIMLTHAYIDNTIVIKLPCKSVFMELLMSVLQLV